VIAESVFWIAIALVAYAYAGYPLVVLLAGLIRPRPVRRAEIEPSLTVIIAARNEERRIAEKLENTLDLDYPPDKLEIIVASDCSSDGTDTIVSRYAGRGVFLCRVTERLGKSAAQNRAVRISNGDILVFSDATTFYRRDALRKLVRSFADPRVGGVTGQLVYSDSADVTGKGCRSYWSYEKLIRQWESRTGSLIGVSGCIYAIRRSCYAKIALDMSSDFVIATEIHLRGLRTVYDPDAIAIEETNRRSSDEFKMRVRVIEQTFTALHRYRPVLNPLTNGMYGVQMLSHKLLRYAAPLFLIVSLLANLLLLSESAVYQFAFAGQMLFYIAAATGWYCDRRKMKIGLIGVPYYFALAGVASIAAFAKFVRGESYVIWEPLRESRTTE
jgi:cellulose synthase/poly-beta-1,6-N-acetylglucosamine synthase-like glycosyltransferase